MLTDDILQLHSLQVAPDSLIRVQLRSIGGQLLQVDPLSGRAGQKSFDLMAAVDGVAIPDDQQPHRDVGGQVPQEPRRIWYLRLRGYEIDQADFGRKSFGNTYALGKQTNDPRELAKLLMKLCEKTGRRLRKAGYTAQGVHVSCVYTDFSFWHTGREVDQPLYTTREIYLKVLRLLNQSGYPKQVRNLAVSVYDLIPHQSEQLEMFSSKSHAVAQAVDRINDKYDEFVITPALMMGMDDTIIDHIAFGGVKELEELYQQ
jgi:hypothetical protein